mgnify:CR=1 FL=1|tara:strand:- start:7123 stop:8379 length:1257 start_codon:yes stop_codon:yes gene_type:complete
MAGEWFKGYLQAKFRGISFSISAHSYKGGRRIVEHDFPYVDQIGKEDLGAKQQEISLSAYIIDDNYFGQRNQLVKALDKLGVGTLIHPYLGTMRVRVKDYELKETTAEGRIARFKINFLHEQTIQAPLVTATTNTVAAIQIAKVESQSIIDTEFTTGYIEHTSLFITDTPTGPLTTVNAAMDDIIDTIDSVIDEVEKVKQLMAPFSEFKQKIATIKGKLIQLAITGVDIAAELYELVDFGNIIENPTIAIQDALKQFDEMEKLFGIFDVKFIDTPDSIYYTENNPNRMVTNLVSQCAVSSAFGLMAVIEYQTVEEALEVRNTLFTQLDIIENTTNVPADLVYMVRGIRQAVMEHLDNVILSLSREVTIQLKEDTPSLVVAYKLYGDLEQEEELIKRNGVIHPAFMPADRELQAVYRDE